MSDPPIGPAESTQNTKLPWLNPINYAASLITIFGAIAGAIVAVSAVVALFWYSYLQPKLNDMVITTIADDLKKPDSIILNQVVSAIKLDLNSKNGDLIAPIIHIYEFKIAQRFDKMFGEMTLGLLILTKKDPQGYIHLFDPPARFGTIYLKIENLLEGIIATSPGQIDTIIVKKGSAKLQVISTQSEDDAQKYGFNLYDDLTISEYFGKTGAIAVVSGGFMSSFSPTKGAWIACYQW